MSKTTASPSFVAPIEHAQKAYKEVLGQVLNLNLDALKAGSKAHMEFLGTLGQTRPNRNALTAAGEATQRYFHETQERAVAYFQSSFSLVQSAGTKLQQAATA